MIKFIVDSWDSVMNANRNPLRHLDTASQHFLMQVLGWMWSMVFSLAFLSIFQFGLVWLAHLLLFGGVAFTVATFKAVEARIVLEPVRDQRSARRDPIASTSSTSASA